MQFMFVTWELYYTRKLEHNTNKQTQLQRYAESAKSNVVELKVLYPQYRLYPM